MDIDVTQPSSLALLTKAEIDQQIATAHAFPRSLAKFQAEALSMATLDTETAESCFYILPRGDGIEGPSVRLAEIVGCAWGNLRYGARVIEVGQQFVTAEGVCHDLQRNVAASVSVRRRITTKDGKRFSEDMITVTCNAACSIALRNAIFKVVPFAYVKPIYEKARQVAAGDADTLDAKRTKWLAYFAKQGITEQRVLWAFNRPSVADLDQGDILKMIGMTTAAKEGDGKLSDMFPTSDPAAQEQDTPPAPQSKAEKAAAKATAAKAEAPKDTGAATPLPSTDAAPQGAVNDPTAPASAEIKADTLTAKTPIFVKMIGSKKHTKRIGEMDADDLAAAYEAAQVEVATGTDPARISHAKGVINLIDGHRASLK